MYLFQWNKTFSISVVLISIARLILMVVPISITRIFFFQSVLYLFQYHNIETNRFWEPSIQRCLLVSMRIPIIKIGQSSPYQWVLFIILFLFYHTIIMESLYVEKKSLFWNRSLIVLEVWCHLVKITLKGLVHKCHLGTKPSVRLMMN